MVFGLREGLFRYGDCGWPIYWDRCREALPFFDLPSWLVSPATTINKASSSVLFTATGPERSSRRYSGLRAVVAATSRNLLKVVWRRCGRRHEVCVAWDTVAPCLELLI